jgi:ferredoxin-type protein NapH
MSRLSPARRRALLAQLLRKLIQLSVLLLIVWTALNTVWRNFKVAHNSERLVGLLTGDLGGWLYGRNEELLALFGEPRAVSEAFLGAPWGMRFLGISMSDPWSLTAVLAAGELPPTAMVLAALPPLLLALAAGRVFCSHICPARLIFEVGGLVRQGLIRAIGPLPELAIPPMGLWVAAGMVGASASTGAAVFHFTLPYLGLSSSIYSAVLAGSIGASGVMFAAMVLVDALLAPGQICRSLCPTGALLGAVGRWTPWRLRKAEVGQRPCPSSCNLCQRACPYGLFPGKNAHFPGCDTCGRCAVVCPDSKLSRSIRLRSEAM